MKRLEEHLVNCFCSRIIYGLVISEGKGRGIEIRLWDAFGNEELSSEMPEIDCGEGQHCFKFENNNLQLL